MTLRSCIYKRCENYVNLRDRSFNDIRLFSFPKNPERRKKWMELGKVPENLPESMYFFCSDHFDKKFLAVNHRRTVLVGEAVPFPYVEAEIDESNKSEDNINYLLYKMDNSNKRDKEQYDNNQDILVESTTITSDIQEILDEQQVEPAEYIIYSDDEGHKEEKISCNINKRKPDDPLAQATSSRPKIIKTSPAQKSLQRSSEEIIENVQSKNNIFSNIETGEDDTTSTELVDAQHVTTFIFKGEEYVQMPKDYYINEKVELIKKLQKMENALQAIKGYLTTLDI